MVEKTPGYREWFQAKCSYWESFEAECGYSKSF